MKILTVNFLTCAVKTCKASLSSTNTTNSSATSPTPQSPFPLHFKDCTLTRSTLPFNATFITNILPRLNWDALLTTATELGLGDLVPGENPFDVGEPTPPPPPIGGPAPPDAGTTQATAGDEMDTDAEVQESDQDAVLRQLHTLLLETEVQDGKLACGKCGFEYPIKDGVGNFLLPSHLV